MTGARIGVLICAIAASAYFVVTKGCRTFPESSFDLASDSRLPKWIGLPPGVKRGDLRLSMDYYTIPWGPTVGFILKDKSGRVIQQIYGNQCSSRFALAPSVDGYPAYEPIVVNGLVEVIEHKRMEPIFYVTDDPPVTVRNKTKSCH